MRNQVPLNVETEGVFDYTFDGHASAENMPVVTLNGQPAKAEILFAYETQTVTPPTSGEQYQFTNAEIRVTKA